MGRYLEAEPLYHRAIEISRSGTVEATLGPWLLRDYASTLCELGRPGEATSYAERAYSRAQTQSQATMADTALLVLFMVDLGLGKLDSAEAKLAQVGPRLQRDLPEGHYIFALLWRDRGLLAEAKGDFPTALNSMNRAIAILQSTLKGGKRGPEHAGRLFVYRSEIFRKMGHNDDAVTDAQTALGIMQAYIPRGVYSADVGRAYLDLGLALRAKNKTTEARAAFRSASEHLKNSLGSEHPDSRTAQEFAR